MQKEIRKIILVLCLALLLPAILFVTALRLPAVYGETYYAELPALVERLDQAEGKKLILIGGSNIAFGVDSEMLASLLTSQGYPYTVCPLGLYAAVGTSAMLSLSEKALSEGDVVVLSIEPTPDAMTTYFGATAFLKCSERALWMIPRLNKSQRSAVYGNYAGFLQERFAVVRSGQLPIASGAYTKEAFNEQGNMVYLREGNTMALGFDYGDMIDLKALRVSEALSEQVRDYCLLASSRGAAVYFSFSPMNASALTDASEEAVQAFFTQINESFPCPVISDPHDYILDSGWFYDSNFHLNSAGAQVRTFRLAQDLLAQLGCYKPLAFELPAMPPSAAAAAEESTDTRYFRFEALGEAGWLLTGLSEEGLQQQTLSLPSSYQGKPVAALAPRSFAGADRLEELHIPESIPALPDEAFADCPKLTRVVLAHLSRPCDITEHTLDGAPQALRFFVPNAVYPFYRDGFGCEGNGWTFCLDRVYTY